MSVKLKFQMVNPIGCIEFSSVQFDEWLLCDASSDSNCASILRMRNCRVLKMGTEAIKNCGLPYATERQLAMWH